MFRLSLVLGLVACGPTARDGAPDASLDAFDPPVVDAIVASGPVTVVITADNAYSFGYGDSAGITNFTQGLRAQTAGQIFNCPLGEGPETYTVPAASAPEGAFLYIVAWDDLAVTQGVIAQFTRATGELLTGDTRFEVCATGIDYSTGPDAQVGPSQAVINTEIARCNAGSGDASATSKGWVNGGGATTSGALGRLAIGEANDDQAGTFPIACPPMNGALGIPSTAQWMWYDPVDGNGGDAFHSTGANRFKAFLIFRLGVEAILL